MALPDEPKLAEAERMLRASFGGVGATPSEADAQAAFDRLWAIWQDTGRLDGARRRDIGDAPWCFFVQGDRGDNPKLASAYVALGRLSTSLSVKLINAFLFGYPRRWHCFREWRGGIASLAVAGRSHRLDSWNALSKRFGFLTEDGPRLWAKALAESDRSADEFILESGISGVLADGEFIKRAFKVHVADIERQLDAGALSGEELTQLLRKSTAEVGRVSRTGNVSDIARAVLHPFNDKMPGDDICSVIVQRLQRLVGDPHLQPARWQGLEQEERVFRKLIAIRTVELFFELLAQTAVRPDHWEERRQFWSSYRAAGRIDDAWFALGPDAQQLARRRAKELRGGYGEFRGSGDRSHSILIMVIGDCVVVEGTHNMKARFWRRDNGAPETGQRTYSRNEIYWSPAIVDDLVHGKGWQGRAHWIVRKLS